MEADVHRIGDRLQIVRLDDRGEHPGGTYGEECFTGLRDAESEGGAGLVMSSGNDRQAVGQTGEVADLVGDVADRRSAGSQF